ncbi:MAG: type IV pilus assembly protein PilM [Actinomycetes bacterium]
MAGRSAIGLDIGTSAVRAAQLSHGKGGVTLDRFGEVALPAGAVRDGEVVAPDVVATAIKKLWSTYKFSGKKVVLGVANQKVVVRMIDLPWMPADEIRQTLAFQVQDFVPMPVDSAVLDFHAIEEFTSQAGARRVRGLLVAASRDMVISSVNAVRMAGLTPVMVDLDSFAVLRSVATPDEFGLNGGVEALVDVGARVTNVIVHEGGVPRFVRILLMGGEDLVEAVAERAGVDHGRAQEMTWDMGLPTTAATAAPGVPGQAPAPSSTDSAARALESATAALLEEIRGSLDYHVASSGSAPISRTLLTGGGARLDGLAERLQAVTRTPVEHGNPLASMQVGKVRLSPQQMDTLESAAAVPVGLALGAAA